MMDTKILVVDDDPNISDLLKIYFENEGYDVKTVADGVEGVNAFKQYEPDLVLLDLMLPKKDGWQVCREIREISAKPIIMVTAKGEVFDKVLGLELGAPLSDAYCSEGRRYYPVRKHRNKQNEV